jgi:DNA ligase 1
MDLMDFDKNKKEEEIKLFFEDENVKIEKKGKEKIYYFKTKKGFKKYSDEVFCSLTESKILNSVEETKDYLKKSQDDGVEGIMLKILDAKYETGLRIGSMYKLKETKEDLDLVILGAEMGTGKRSGFYSSFIVGIKYLENDFLEIGKVASGIKEIGEEGISMSYLTKILKPLKIKEEKEIIYFRPEIIVQVRYQEIQKSTTYNSGFALRFPRLIMLRKDKGIDEINSIEDVKNLI